MFFSRLTAEEARFLTQKTKDKKHKILIKDIEKKIINSTSQGQFYLDIGRIGSEAYKAISEHFVPLGFEFYAGGHEGSGCITIKWYPK